MRGERFRSVPYGYLHSIFVEGIPEKASSMWMWNMFKEAGQIADIFMPRKWAKSGNRFAFIRFKLRWEAERAIKLFDGRIVAGKRILTNLSDKGNRRQIWRKKGEKSMYEGPNRAKMEIHSTPPSQQKCRGIEVKADEKSLEKLAKCIVGTARESFEVTWLLDQFEREDWNSIWITRISELKFILGFKEESLREEIQRNDWDKLRKWFVEINSWSLEHEIGDRIAKISIQGLPLIFWNSSNIDAIVNRWGRRCNLSDPMSTPGDARVCFITIVTNQRKRIEDEVVLYYGQKEVRVWCSEYQVPLVQGMSLVVEESLGDSSRSLGVAERNKFCGKRSSLHESTSSEPNKVPIQAEISGEDEEVQPLNAVCSSQSQACSAVEAKVGGQFLEEAEGTNEC